MSVEPQHGSTHRNVGMRIVSDPDTTRMEQPGVRNANVAVQMPLRLLYAADLTPGEGAEWTGGTHLRRVDRNRFPELLKELSPRLEVEVPGRIEGGPRRLEVALRFEELRDFHPERLARQVPVLARLLDLRELVALVERREIDAPTLQRRLVEMDLDGAWADRLRQLLAAPSSRPGATPPPAPRPPAGGQKRSGDDALDRLLGLVDLGGAKGAAPPEEAATPEMPASGLFGALMGAASDASTSASASRADRAAAGALLDDLDHAIGVQLNAVLGHPAVRRLEAAWRGLKFLVDRIDFRAGVELDVLAVPKAETDDALYHQVLLPEHSNESARPPLSAIVLGHAFDNSHGDVTLLGELATTAASLQTPMLAAVAPSFFGVEQEAGLGRLPLVWQQLERPEYIAWKSLCARDEARYLALALPGFLLRPPYGADHPAASFAFEEEGCLWGSGALLVTAAVAQSFSETGWPTRVTGRTIADLPAWRSAAGPTAAAALLTDEKAMELSEAGFVVVSGEAGRDTVRIAHAPTLRRGGGPADADDPTLAGQLFVSRVAHFLATLQQQLEVGPDVEAAERAVTERVGAFLQLGGTPDAGDFVAVAHQEQDGQPDQELFAVRLRAPGTILEEPIRLVLGLQLPAERGRS